MKQRTTFEREIAALRGGNGPTAAGSRSPAPPVGSGVDREFEFEFEANVAPPPLIRREVDALGCTLYVEIPLGAERPAKPMTGIFIPRNFARSAKVDLVIYLHGHKKDLSGRWYNDLTIDKYWDTKPFDYFPLRQRLNESGKRCILVAPTLGPKAQAGRLLQRGGFDALVQQILAALPAYGPFTDAKEPPAVGKIVLSAHSAGGKPMLAMATLNDLAAAHVQECWGFDCLYSGRHPETKRKLFGQPDKWLTWAAKHADANLRVFFLKSTKDESCHLKHRAKSKRLKNVHVERSNARNHFLVPIAHWTQLLTLV